MKKGKLLFDIISVLFLSLVSCNNASQDSDKSNIKLYGRVSNNGTAWTSDSKEITAYKLTISSPTPTAINYELFNHLELSFDGDVDSSDYNLSKVNYVCLMDYIISIENLSLINEFRYADLELWDGLMSISDNALYNFSNRGKVIFHGPLCHYNELTFSRNGGETTIYHEPGDSSFPRYLNGKRTYIIGGEDIAFPSDMDLNEYCYESTVDAKRTLDYFYQRAQESNTLYQYYYPFTASFEDYLVIDEFTEKLLSGINSEKEKVNTVFQYVTSEIDYDDSYLEQEPYKCFVDKKAVCAQYVCIMHDMLASAGIVSFYCNGYARFGLPVKSVESMVCDYVDEYELEYYNKKRHAWLGVYIDGELEFYDPTWNRYFGNDLQSLSKQYIFLSADFHGVKPQVIDEFFYYNSENGLFYNHSFLIDGHFYEEAGGNINQFFPISIEKYQAAHSSMRFISGEKPATGEIFRNAISSNSNLYYAHYYRDDGLSIGPAEYISFLKLLSQKYGWNFDGLLLSMPDKIIVDNENYYLDAGTGEAICFLLADQGDTLIVPSSVNGLKVVSVLDCAFVNRKIKKMVVSEGIRSLTSLRYLPELEEVELPSSFETFTCVGNPFRGSHKLTKVLVADGNLEYLYSDGALYSADGKTLRYVMPTVIEFSIPTSVRAIGQYAFEGSHIRSIFIPKTVATIYGSAFQYCYFLESVVFEERKNEIELWGYTFYSCYKLKDVVLTPNMCSLYQGNSSHTITASMFGECISLTNIVIPEGIVVIEDWAFYDAGLIQMSLPSSLVNIGNSSFAFCEKLKEIITPSSDNFVSYFSGVSFIEDASLSKCKVIDNFVFYLGEEENLMLSYIGNNEVVVLPTTKFNYLIIFKSFFSVEIDYSYGSLPYPHVSKESWNTTELVGTQIKQLYLSTSVAGIIGEHSKYYEDRFYFRFPALEELHYHGTVNEFNSMKKTEFWNTYMPIHEVICQDGRVPLN